MAAPPIDELRVRPLCLKGPPRDGVGHLDAIEDGQENLERLRVAGGDEKVRVALAGWMEVGTQIEGPRLSVRLEPPKLVVEGRQARDQDALFWPGCLGHRQGREGGKASHEEVVLHKPAVEHILGQRTVADGIEEFCVGTEIPEFPRAQCKARFREVFHLRPSLR